MSKQKKKKKKKKKESIGYFGRLKQCLSKVSRRDWL